MTRLLIVLLWLVCGVAWAESAESIVKDVEKTLSPGNFTTVYKMTSKRIDDTVVTYEIRFGIRDVNHAHGVFLKPEREKGREILRVNDALWTYMPDVGRAIRIADRDSFAGGDFSNADVMRPDWTAHYAVEMVKETARQWILDLNASGEGATYARMRLWVDRKLRQPVQMYFYDTKGTLLKRCRYGAITRFGNLTRPARLKMENVLTGQSTDLQVLKLQTGQKFSDARFSVDNLGK